MSGFDRLGRELELAAEREHGRRRGRRRPGPAIPWARRAGGVGGAAAMAAALASVAVVVVGALALLHGHAGRSGSTAPAGSAQPAPAAQAAAWARLLTCGAKPQGAPASGLLRIRTTISDAPPDARLAAALGVLRAPWTSADAAPPATCKSVVPQGMTGSFNARYVRAIGPGLDGGEVFLVPATFQIPLFRGARIIPARTRAATQDLACLITVGGRRLGAEGCTELGAIDRPLGVVLATLRPPRPSAALARKACAKLPAAARAQCRTMMGKGVPYAPLPDVIAGVVRDGIATVNVYARVKGVRTHVLTVPVADNVYEFRTGGAVTGELTLVFRDATGQTVPTEPIHTGTVTATAEVGQANIPLTTGTVTGTATATVTAAPAPPPSSVSPRTAAPRRR